MHLVVKCEIGVNKWQVGYWESAAEKLVHPKGETNP